MAEILQNDSDWILVLFVAFLLLPWNRSRQWPKLSSWNIHWKAIIFNIWMVIFYPVDRCSYFFNERKKMTSQILYQLTSLFERTVWICFNKTKTTMRENMMSLSSFYPKSIEKEENIDNLSETLILNFIVHYILNVSMQPLKSNAKKSKNKSMNYY